jgi:hypothetical protein
MWYAHRYAYEQGVNQSRMERAAEVLATYRHGGVGPTLAELGYSYVQLDDGYQVTIIMGL